MKLTIDTREDSKEEIRKAIKMLSAIVGDDFYTNSPSSSQTKNLFESNSGFLSASPASQQPQQETGGLFNMFGAVEQPAVQKAEEKKEKTPQIIIEY